MEEHLEQQIVTDDAIKALVGAARPYAEWYFGMSSLGLGPNVAVPNRPYIVINELADVHHQVVSETSNSRTRNFQIFVYDEKGDFTRIDQILKELRRIVKAMAPFTTAAGVRCSESKVFGFSGQIVDDGYDSCAKYMNAQFLVSQ